MHVVLPQLCGLPRQGSGGFGGGASTLKTTAIAAQTHRPPLEGGPVSGCFGDRNGSSGTRDRKTSLIGANECYDKWDYTSVNYKVFRVINVFVTKNWWPPPPSF